MNVGRRYINNQYKTNKILYLKEFIEHQKAAKQAEYLGKKRKTIQIKTLNCNIN